MLALFKNFLYIQFVISNNNNDDNNNKGKGSPCSITGRRVPDMIPILGSQRAGDVSHRPGGRLPLL